MVERGLVTAVMAVIVIAVLGVVGDDLVNIFNTFVCQLTEVVVCEVE